MNENTTKVFESIRDLPEAEQKLLLQRLETSVSVIKESKEEPQKKPFVNAAFSAIENRIAGFARAAYRKMGMPYPGDKTNRSSDQK